MVLRMEGIAKEFPGVRALDAVNFDLRAGEVHVLLGENGAGKSTLIKILAGLYQKDEGRILLEGKEVEIDSPRRARELGIRTIYQELNLIPQLSVAENIFLGEEPVGPARLIDRATMNSVSADFLRSLGRSLDPRIPVEELSVADRQMVEIAKAIRARCRIMVMDEPTSSLDQEEVKALFAVVRRLREQGVGIIYISHRLEEVAEIGDRVSILRDGRHVHTGPVQELSPEDTIRLMVGRELAEKFPWEPREAGEEVLRVEGLGEGNAFRDISFSLRRGEILGLAGLVGAGRTEMARAILGVDRADQGNIVLRGERLRPRTPRDTIRRGLGLIPEDRKNQGVILLLSVAANITLVALGRLVRWLFLDRKREAVLPREYAGRLNIATPRLDRQVRFLSGGNQQKVVLAKWLCSGADVLIFDEPTRGIDVGAKYEVHRLMVELARGGAGVLMISSEMPEILGMSDRILVMREGRLTGEFSRAEATQEKILRAAMLDEAPPAAPAAV
ncbi:MAG: sugar ABC transporter ATP-binding protein [Candidatus Tectomicrobia bacterium]|uniref:Sugar ABC transporter ATP-binding protein n=1 Tax=Tectimicrobiota bacterium TaxID=2528274 RepID=A0A932I021_UNCTE|nr:sugar ABC transporter ATP-binding protein [Candidatus Tectomicrobia bacterium]